MGTSTLQQAQSSGRTVNTRTEDYSSVYTEREVRVVEVQQASFDKLRTNGARITLRANGSVHQEPVEGKAS
jgi:hypothetical protein